MRVGVDLDGVLYDFVESLRSYILTKPTFGPPLTAEQMPSPTSWEFYLTDWGIQTYLFLELCDKGVDAGYIFKTGEPMPGALRAMRELKAAGHGLHIITDRFFGSLSEYNTRCWLAEHDVPFDTLTFSKDKTCVPTDMFIDDKPENVLALRAAGCHAFLLNAMGRKDQAGFEPAISVHNWHEFVQEVRKLTPQVIGLSGYGKAGKDSVGAVLAPFGWQRLAFADALKKMLYRLDPLIYTKDEAVWRVQDLVERVGWDTAKETDEVRGLCQRMGTEAGRQGPLGQDVWLAPVLNQIKPGGKYVITDCRFPNEADAIRAAGGQVLRVIRPGNKPVNAHKSETALDHYAFDGYILNNGTLDDLSDEVNRKMGFVPEPKPYETNSVYDEDEQPKMAQAGVLG
jgi:FMN phosphatase YigB (HAD superfamily)